MYLVGIDLLFIYVSQGNYEHEVTVSVLARLIHIKYI